ncbi:FAD dependent oxidoreductase [Streptomyces noursei ATCC 11455]|uniref:NAD(P)/FAD-dependent oxidoreductase n=1 Tax=Streptomyces noursei TaxID=1971 RepID=UPI00081C8A13|nr:FAD dependent oxidoreductase [Streptomyces noursei ATCC 11455]
MNDSVYDVVVGGAGAAGLNAALVLGRARRRVAVVDAGEPRNAPAAHMQGFLSRDGMPPGDLLTAGRAEVARYGVSMIKGWVEDITHGFFVRLAGGATLKARRVLVATGLHDEVPAIPGVRERWGRDVLHCPYCHGYEVRDQPIGVIGNPHGSPGFSVHQTLLLTQWSDDVVFFPHTLELVEQEREKITALGVRINEGEVERLVTDSDRLRGVQLGGGRVAPRSAVFVGPRFVPHDALLTSLGCARSENGWVSTDPTGRTSVFGVWAAGNVTDPRAQVITAAGMGSAAAIAINVSLLDEDADRAVEAYRSAGQHYPTALEWGKWQAIQAVLANRGHAF